MIWQQPILIQISLARIEISVIHTMDKLSVEKQVELIITGYKISGLIFLIRISELRRD
jgi:hypothetical protein